MNTKLKIALAATAATAITAGTVVTTVPSALASVTGQGTVKTHSGSLSVNDAPRLESNRRGWVKPGQRVKITCQTYGDAVNGIWGTTTLWDYVDGIGYASDGFIDTHTNGRLPGVPLCGQDKGKPAAQPAPKPADAAPGGYQYPFTGTFHLPFKQGASYPVTQTPFNTRPGATHNPNTPKFGKYNKHAIDFGTPMGTSLYAPGPGKVVYAGSAPHGWGNKILIDHGNNRCTILAHLSRVDTHVGARVNTGDFVGRSGDTGNGPAHLHYGIVRCDNGLSLETPATYEMGTRYGLDSAARSTNPTR